MQTQKRLSEAYENARIEYFDENSKYVFMSDAHRGNGSHSDEFTKNRNIFIHALKHYNKKGFTYVEVGDGDELWEHPKAWHIKNAHYEVFEQIRSLYKDDRFIMLYGNHNIYLKNPKYVEKHYYSYFNSYTKQTKEFLYGIKPEESLLLKNKKTGQEILVVHGHQGDFSNDHIWYLTMLSLKYFWRYLHAFGIKNPASPIKNTTKRHRIENNITKWIREHNKMVICGHTHRFKYPREHEYPYFNTGCCIYPTTITAIELEKGVVKIVRWKVKTNETGNLYVDRKIIRGPDPVSKFDFRKKGV